MHFIVYTYLPYLYTTHVVWQTKCELVRCITCIAIVHMPKLRTTVLVHIKIFYGKCAGIYVYQHAYVKYILSCTVNSVVCKIEEMLMSVEDKVCFNGVRMLINYNACTAQRYVRTLINVYIYMYT